jgi:hypothetical protein
MLNVKLFQHEPIYVPVVRHSTHTCGEPFLACSTKSFNVSHVEGLNSARIDGSRQRAKDERATRSAAAGATSAEAEKQYQQEMQAEKMIHPFSIYEEALPTMAKIGVRPNSCFSVCKQYIHASHDSIPQVSHGHAGESDGVKISSTTSTSPRRPTVVDCTSMSSSVSNEKAIATITEILEKDSVVRGETRILV